MTLSSKYFCFGLILATGFGLQARAEDAKDDKEAMEIGGLLTIDGANKFKDWEYTPAQLGSVELSANVHVDSNMEGSITLLSEAEPGKSEPGTISIDQAVGQWTLSQGQIIFGQQSFNLGLLSTRTISDPLLLDLGDFNRAGVTGLLNRGSMTFGVGLTSVETLGEDSSIASDPCLVLNSDFAPEGQLIRIGVQASRARQALDIAANLTHGDFLLDMETLWRWKDEDDLAKGGYTAGIAWQINSILQPAFRWDALGDENEFMASQAFTAGITVSPVDHVFGAGEVTWDQDGEASFAVQMGLQSTLKLPGFQRKTLTR